MELLSNKHKTNRLNILFLTYVFYPQIGGIEVNSEILATEFHKKGHNIVLVTMAENEEKDNFPFKVVRRPSLRELFKLHSEADVVFENNPSLRLSWPKNFYKSAKVIALRGGVRRSTTGKRVLRDYLKLYQIKRANGVIAVSEFIRRDNFKGAHVIGNPFRIKQFKNLGFERPPLSFVMLGRLVSVKGFDIGIEAIGKLSEQIRNKVTVKIVGDGPEMKNLKELANNLDMNNQVQFLGAKRGNDLVEALNSCRYMLVPSRDEAFGNVVLEGMACGCLPIVSDTGGLVDAVGDAGFIFPNEKTEELTKLIEKIVGNPDLENQYKARIKDHLQNHEPKRVAERYLEVIYASLDKHRK